MDARVGVELPRVDGDLPVCTGFCFLLGLFATAVVDWAAFGFFCERAGAGDDLRGLVVRTERLLPAGVVGSWLAGPAGCVGGTGIPTVGCVVRVIIRAIAIIRRLSITTPYRSY